MHDKVEGSWGIDPVPERLRVLGALDTGLLWGNLGVSLLVIVAGAALVPALSLPDALAAIVLLLLDEPTAGMGPAESADMVRLLAALRGRLGIILVEHDMDAVFALADRITVMVYGRVVATGAPDAIRADPQVRRAYLGEDDV